MAYDHGALNPAAHPSTLPGLMTSRTMAMPAKHMTRFVSFSSLALWKRRAKGPIGMAAMASNYVES